ncbi:conjugal transfer protein TraF [uncultured Lamprocystis sp.]|jgi:conjugal transfer pilus assembly protein TraF|uniref:conjugal transfer protein TraF n=1 Tax=uncultured Lamprocystis sp. TaxID=543132 RepID=UPI0025CE3A37|nr:conjugal transfer protein TraF [uncultured Lamprocystis sp.]
MSAPSPRQVIAVGLGLLVAAGALAEPGRFYERKGEGWFWYRDPKPVLPAEPVDPAPAAEPPAPPVASVPEATPVSVAAPPPPLSAAWMREHLDRYRDRAIDEPTPENVAAYFYLQRIVLDKSSKFASVAQRVVQGDPFLDEITQRPTATFGANLANKTAGEARDALLRRIGQLAAVWFFYRSDCPYCEAQAPLLDLMASRYGFTVLAVSLDGKALPSGFFPRFRPDSGQARALGVRSTPALFLVRPEGPAFAPVAQGVLSLAQLQERFVLAAVTAGWVSEAEVSPTRAVTADTRGALLVPPDELPDDPTALVARLRELIHE